MKATEALKKYKVQKLYDRLWYEKRNIRNLLTCKYVDGYYKWFSATDPKQRSQRLTLCDALETFVDKVNDSDLPFIVKPSTLITDWCRFVQTVLVDENTSNHDQTRSN